MLLLTAERGAYRKLLVWLQVVTPTLTSRRQWASTRVLSMVLWILRSFSPSSVSMGTGSGRVLRKYWMGP